MTGGLATYVHLQPGFRDPLFAAKREVYGERAVARPEAVRLVVLGSSRSAAAIEPRALAAVVEAETGRPCVAFNLSVAGAGPITQHVHARRLLAAGPVPDVAVVECLPVGFGWTAAGPYDTAVLKPERLTREELEVVTRYGFPNGVRDAWAASAANPWDGFKFHILGRAKPRWRPPGVVAVDADRAAVEKGDGWGPWDRFPAAVAAQRLAEVRASYEEYLRSIDFNRPPAAAFRETVRLLQAAGVRVVVVTTPESREFRGWYPPDVEARVRAYLAGVQAEFGVPVVDTRDWLPEEAFADGHHVVRGWAGPFTERLVRESSAPESRRP